MAFRKGKSGNPHGRPKGSYALHTMLEKAIKEVEAEQGIDFLREAVKRALKSDAVMIALLRKIVPDKTEFSGEIIHTDKQVLIVYENNHTNRATPETERDIKLPSKV